MGFILAVVIVLSWSARIRSITSLKWLSFMLVPVLVLVCYTISQVDQRKDVELVDITWFDGVDETLLL